jgi:transcriptional regulator with XRE-family HTH domain
MTDQPSRLTAAGRRRGSGGAEDVDGRRLAVARRLACMPRSELARRIGVTPAAVTQYERGLTRPTTTVLERIGLALGMPQEFFSRGLDFPEVRSSTAHFRSLRSTPANRREQALAFGELALAVLDLIERYVDLPAVRLPSIDLPLQPSNRLAELGHNTAGHLAGQGRSPPQRLVNAVAQAGQPSPP